MIQEIGSKKPPRKRDPKFTVSVALWSSQVRAFWQWHRRLLSNLGRSNAVPLRINLDETSIVLNHNGQKGVVTKSLERDIVLVKKISEARFFDLGGDGV